MHVLLAFLLTTTPPIEPHIRTLSADAMEGRGLNTKGLDKAADYIEKELRAAELEPAFGKSFRQKFPVKTGVALGGGNVLEGSRTATGHRSAFPAPASFPDRSRSSATASTHRRSAIAISKGSTSKEKSR